MKMNVNFFKQQATFIILCFFIMITSYLNAESCHDENEVQAVLFDMDGVLVNTIALETTAFKNFLLEKFGIEVTDDDARQTKSLSHIDIWKYLKEKYQFSEDIETLHQEQRDYYRAMLITSGLHIRDETLIGFLRYLKSKSIKAGVVTSNEIKTTKFILNGLGISQYFDVVITADNVTNVKPFPEPYMQAAIALGIKPRNCFAIEDSKNGIQAAIDACMTAIAVRAPYSERQDFSCADSVITSFDEVVSKNLIKEPKKNLKDEL